MTRLTNSQLRAMAPQIASGEVPVVPAPRPRRRNEESVEQQKVMKWWSKSHHLFGVRECLLHSVPNGGFRSIVTASIMKAEGQRRGVFDIKVNVPRNGSAGLWLEMKAAKGRLSPDQKEFQKAVEEQGYKTAVCFSSFEAINFITTYLTKP